MSSIEMLANYDDKSMAVRLHVLSARPATNVSSLLTQAEIRPVTIINKSINRTITFNELDNLSTSDNFYLHARLR